MSKDIRPKPAFFFCRKGHKNFPTGARRCVDCGVALYDIAGRIKI